MVTVLCAVIIYSGIIYAKRIKIDIISLYAIVTCEAFEVNKKIYTEVSPVKPVFDITLALPPCIAQQRTTTEDHHEQQTLALVAITKRCDTMGIDDDKRPYFGMQKTHLPRMYTTRKHTG